MRRQATLTLTATGRKTEPAGRPHTGEGHPVGDIGFPHRVLALAALFYRSGWTQEELAKKEGKSRIWVVTRLRFGRFLEFITTVIKSENDYSDLTEGRFRKMWERTDNQGGNERVRFSLN